MASYFNLVLDTLAPQELSVKLNNGAQYTTTKSVTLAISVSDASTTGYQMKVWGIEGVESESDATWETFATKSCLVSSSAFILCSTLLNASTICSVSM